MIVSIRSNGSKRSVADGRRALNLYYLVPSSSFVLFQGVHAAMTSQKHSLIFHMRGLAESCMIVVVVVWDRIRIQQEEDRVKIKE